MRIALTGSSGLIGTRFTQLLKDKHQIYGVSTKEGVDIVNMESVFSKLSSINPEIIVHMAAKTNVDQCEEDKEKDFSKANSLGVIEQNEINLKLIKDIDWKNDSSAFAINVVGTKNLADFAQEKNIPLLYISTDFVFDGINTPLGGYSEEDEVSPCDWYGMTKYYGEKVVESLPESLIARISFPYGYKSDVKVDFVWRLIQLMQEGRDLKLVSDQIITPTFIEDVVWGLDFLIEKGEKGVINLTGNSSLSSYEIGLQIADAFSFDKGKIGTILNEEFYKGRAKRPFKAIMKNGKLKTLGFIPKTFQEALSLIKEKS